MSEGTRIGSFADIPDMAKGLGSDDRTVMIYVRKGEGDWERTISINPIPDEADPVDLLEAGFAIDGNSATLSVARTQLSQVEDFITWADPKKGIRSIGEVDVDNFEAPPTLNAALNMVERAIVRWLKGLGYIPKFG